MTTKNYTTNRIKKVWIAEFCDYEEYGRMGIFDSPLKALIACFKDYKEYKKQFPDFKHDMQGSCLYGIFLLSHL